MRIAILCNGRTLAEWQRRAIERIADKHELYLLICDDPPQQRKAGRHGLYYLLNLASVRNRANRSVPFPTADVEIVDRLDFQPQQQGAWSTLPDKMLDWVKANRIDAIVKFGLNLLRIPEGDRLTTPILSYHHGDPRFYRGRPAGFYELAKGEPFLGQVVQILSNKLDSGEVLAFGQSRVSPHSYKQTLIDAFCLSPALLPQALAALGSGQRLPIEPHGPNYRLPGNTAVLRFAAGRAKHLVRRLAYGAFVEKQWRVSLAQVGEAADPLVAVTEASRHRNEWRTFPVRRPHGFHADPFFHGSDGPILLEAMNSRTGKGELLRVSGGEQQPIDGLSGHISYPASVEEGGQTYFVPEIRSWSRPAIFAFEDNRAVRVAGLDIDEEAILDPTILRHEGRLYLFANRASEGASTLRLWFADSLFGRFEEHPASPIRTSVRGSRMAGPIHRWPGGLFRLGQDFRSAYGDGVFAFRIEEITAGQYREVEVGAASFDKVKGPHTVDIRRGELLFDWYEERVSPLAGVRRLMNRL
jgi:hypothetical protein